MCGLKSNILGVVKRNPLFLYEIEWKNNGFFFTTPNILKRSRAIGFSTMSISADLSITSTSERIIFRIIISVRLIGLTCRQKSSVSRCELIQRPIICIIV